MSVNAAYRLFLWKQFNCFSTFLFRMVGRQDPDPVHPVNPVKTLLFVTLVYFKVKPNTQSSGYMLSLFWRLVPI